MCKINYIIQHIHKWGEPEQHPLKAMGLTRLCSVVLAAVESIGIIYYSMRFFGSLVSTLLSQKTFTPLCKKIQPSQSIASNVESPTKKKIFIAKIIAGLASTIFFGIFFSPEINIRLHQKLGLAVDNKNERREKALKKMLEIEAKNEASKKERTAYLAQLYHEKKGSSNPENHDDKSLDEDLKELFYAL